MHARLLKFWEEARNSYWFVPGLMVVVTILLSVLTVSLDSYYQIEVLRRLGFIWSGGAEGARGILQTVAGSMITVAGVTFSITMVALSFASSQFGSRLLRNFMADTGNQIVLGTFVATFIYCLLILRTVRSNSDTEFVPYISVTIGLLLALASLIVLIYFFHHMALSMQAPYVIGQVAADLFKTIERLFPSDAGARRAPQDPQEESIPPDLEDQATTIRSESNGYLQAVDWEELMSIASDNNLIIKLPVRPGDFVIDGQALAYVWPNDRLEHEPTGRLQNNFIIGKQRTHTQDVEFGIEQLVEVAERSLSTGINATYTAITCIDWLGAALADLLRRDFPSPYRYDRHGKLRVVFDRPLSPNGVIDAAFNQIRQSARDNIAVHIRMLERIAVLREMTDDPKTLHALERHAKMIREDSASQALQPEDEKQVDQRYQQATGRDRREP
ncbi:MAG TPA: DUF2254 domain-containing protein [Anaerolineales bacterium]|nr:DUF2254 domain-containing protein [Anaerolineales bacterium]